MNTPNLDRIIDAYIPIVSDHLEGYYNQLQRELIPFIKELQNKDLLKWFSFLIHRAKHLNINGREPLVNDEKYIHLRLEPKNGISIDEFINKLPKHFLTPIPVTLLEMSGIDPSFLQDENWAYAWKLHGEISEMVLSLIENHKKSIPPKQIIQFLHFITNPVGLEHTCFFCPERISF